MFHRILHIDISAVDAGRLARRGAVDNGENRE